MVIKKTALVLTTLLIANMALADSYSKEEKKIQTYGKSTISFPRIILLNY
jgi:hypothetical protein